MLTKEERKAIAERMSEEFDFTENDEVYEALIGEEIPDNTTWEKDCKVVRDRLIELCDTSNMIELPLDKDGEVIHIGDTVFDGYGSKWVVNGIDFKGNGVLIDVFLDGECARFLPAELTHKTPVTLVSLADDIRNILKNDGDINQFTVSKLLDIADNIEKLGNNDD